MNTLRILTVNFYVAYLRLTPHLLIHNIFIQSISLCASKSINSKCRGIKTELQQVIFNVALPNIKKIKN